MVFNKRNKPVYFNSIFTSHIFLSIIVFLITIATFSEVLTADFVQWDDNIIIYMNPNIGKLSLERIRWAFTDVDSMMRYNPLTLLSWCATYQLFGFNPYGYHLGNLILHALSSLILFFIIRIILLVYCEKKIGEPFKQIWRINLIAAISTLFWALHPMRVEPVAWATDRTYCQATFFLLLSTLCYLKAKISNYNIKKYNLLIILSVLLYIFSLLSYAIGITYFLIFLLFDYFIIYQKNEVHDNWVKSNNLRKILLEKLFFALPAFIIGLITVIVRVKSAGVWSPPVPLSEFNLISRFMQAIYIITYFAYRPFYPINLSPVYTTLVSFNPLSFMFVSRAIIFCAISIVLVIFRKRCKLCILLFLAHIILLIPVLGFFEHPHYPVDRYSLLSSICISIFIAISLILITKNKTFILFSIALIMIISIFGRLSFKQVKVWNNSESLFTHMIKTLNGDPYVQDIYWRLGAYLYPKKRTEEAIINLKNTLKINPVHLISHKLLGIIAYERGDFKNAIHHFQIVLKIHKNDPQAIYYMAKIKDLLNR